MRRIYFMIVAGILGSMSFNVFAECTLANCDVSNNPSSCEQAQTAYHACLDREVQARWSAGKAEMQKPVEYKAVKNVDNIQKAVTAGTDGRVTANTAK